LFVLTSTGVRVSELCALEVSDVDVTRGELLVATGTKRERTVFLSDEARVAAALYLDSRADSHPALFLRTGRKQNDGGDPRLIPRQVERLIKKYAAKAGITTPVTPQLIRNTCIATLIKDGVDLPTVRALMGHEHLKSTEVYARCAD
jgi:integrase/recombinase XerC